MIAFSKEQSANPSPELQHVDAIQYGVTEQRSRMAPVLRSVVDLSVGAVNVSADVIEVTGKIGAWVGGRVIRTVGGVVAKGARGLSGKSYAKDE